MRLLNKSSVLLDLPDLGFAVRATTRSWTASFGGQTASFS